MGRKPTDDEIAEELRKIWESLNVKLNMITKLLQELWSKHTVERGHKTDVCYACRAGEILGVKFGK